MAMILKRIAFLFACLAATVLFTSCADSDSRYGYADGSAPFTEPSEEMAESRAVGGTSSQRSSTRRPVTNEPRPWDSGSASASSTAASQFPVAQKISGKPGLVRSPYAPYAGEVDVKGIAAGTQVKCPYTGKIFVVP